MIDKVLEAISSNGQVYELVKTAPLQTLEQMTVEQQEAGEFQLFQGQHYHSTYILVKGRVKVYLNGHNGKSVVLDIYGPGMFLGEQEAIIHEAYSASIINITPVTLLKLPNDAFREWTSRDHRFANDLISNLSTQIFQLTKRVERYSLYSALQQIGLILMQASQEHKLLTREQLTYEVDTSYRNINRVLKQLTDLGAVEVQRSVIKVIDSVKLQTIIKSEG
jgi:CRP-like cAMP-binding protein